MHHRNSAWGDAMTKTKGIDQILKILVFSVAVLRWRVRRMKNEEDGGCVGWRVWRMEGVADGA